MNYSLSNIKSNVLSNFDADSEAWLASQGITDVAIRRRYSNFYTLCKALTPTIWSRLMMVSLRSNEAPRKTWGGGKATLPSQLRNDFVTNGTVNYTTQGAVINYAASFANRVNTPTGFTYNTHRSEPMFIGLIYENQPSTGVFTNSTSLIRWNVGTTSAFLTNYAGGDSVTPTWQVGFALPGADGGQYVTSNPAANNSKDAPQFIGADFQTGRLSVGMLSNEKYSVATHASVAPNTNSVGTGLWFFPALNSTTTTTGTLQYLVFISSGISDIASYQRRIFWHILRTTLLSDVSPALHFAMHGQSLATGTLDRRLQMRLNTTRTVTSSVSSYGGTYISAWVGANPNSPTRASQYTGGFYDGSGGGVAESAWTTGISSNIDNWIVWLQGESDTELASTALVYQQQLQNLFNFLTADFGAYFKMAVNLLDYSIGYRTATAQGNFSVTGFTDAGTSANGTWTIAAISAVLGNGVTTNSLVTNANANYSWTKSGGGTIAKNGSGFWEIAVSGVVYATSNETHTHPELCTWVLQNGATGTPAFSESRTGNIERVRKAQADFVSANSSRCVTFDSRGVTRPFDATGSGDGVHPNAAGEQELAFRAQTAMLA